MSNSNIKLYILSKQIQVLYIERNRLNVETRFRSGQRLLIVPTGTMLQAVDHGLDSFVWRSFHIHSVDANKSLSMHGETTVESISQLAPDKLTQQSHCEHRCPPGTPSLAV